MAWVNVPLPIETGEVTNDSWWSGSDSGEIQQTTPFSGISLNACETYAQMDTNHWIFGDSTFGLYAQGGSSTAINIKPYHDNINDGYFNAIIRGNSNYSDITICCGYNPQTDVGKLLIVYSYKWNGTTYYMMTRATRTAFCRYAYNNPPITYTWQSVSSISGKNGILSLSQAKTSALNNGEPVSSASASDFDSLTAQVSTLVTDDSQMAGKEAGGISGSGDNSANQSTGNAFGQGESGTNVSGGGSGLYGGYKGTSAKSGGAGSGYIGNSLVSNKKMVGYNVPTSSAEGTKTESVNEASATPVSNKPKIGNGFARVKFLREVSGGTLYELAKTRNTDNMQLYVANQWWNDYLTHFASYLGSNNILQCVRRNDSRIASYNGYTLDTTDTGGVSETEILIPIQHITVSKVTCIGHTSSYTGQYRYGWVYLYKIENNALVKTATLFQVNGGVDATSSIVLDEPVEADYISFFIGDGSATFHDIVFNGD